MFWEDGFNLCTNTHPSEGVLSLSITVGEASFCGICLLEAIFDFETRSEVGTGTRIGCVQYNDPLTVEGFQVGVGGSQWRGAPCQVQCQDPSL